MIKKKQKKKLFYYCLSLCVHDFISLTLVRVDVIYLFIIIPDEANMAKRWILNNN